MGCSEQIHCMPIVGAGGACVTLLQNTFLARVVCAHCGRFASEHTGGGMDCPEPEALSSKEQTPADLLGAILAIIHGDGGQYQAKHGDARATADAIAKYYATRFDALCPHGMPLAENICGPCSQGRPNRPAVETAANLNAECLGCGQRYEAIKGHVCPAVKTSPDTRE